VWTYLEPHWWQLSFQAKNACMVGHCSGVVFYVIENVTKLDVMTGYVTGLDYDVRCLLTWKAMLRKCVLFMKRGCVQGCQCFCLGGERNECHIHLPLGWWLGVQSDMQCCSQCLNEKVWLQCSHMVHTWLWSLMRAGGLFSCVLMLH
jgi:hypothetical protein